MEKRNVKLYTMTGDALNVCAVSALGCRDGRPYNDIVDKVELEMTHIDKVILIRKCIEMGHLTIIEPIQFTFLIERISRACSHQLVRSRIASFSQESQRAVNMSNYEPILPDSISATEYTLGTYDSAIASSQQAYEELIAAGVPEEDARYLTPNAAPTKMTMTCNARELLHMFELRLCMCA